MTNDLDDLMARIDESLRTSGASAPADIDAIIAWHREQRRRRAAGEKPTKPTVDLSAIKTRIMARGPEVEPIKRRI